jgi:hypothetical protein
MDGLGVERSSASFAKSGNEKEGETGDSQYGLSIPQPTDKGKAEQEKRKS